MMAATSHPPFVSRTKGLVERIAVVDRKLLEAYSFTRNFGPTALQIAYVAAGRIDAFAEDGFDTFNWLPGILIAREAGARVLSLNGQAWTWGDDSLLIAEESVANLFVDSQSRRSN